MPSSQDRCISELLQRPPKTIPLLPNKAFDSSLTPLIHAINPLTLRASLFLLNDDIENCHEIVQSHEGVAEMDLMHSILHRRESDFWNSKWWVSRPTWSFPQKYLDTVYRGNGNIKARAKNYVDRVEKWKQSRDKQVEEELQDVQYHELSSIVNHLLS